MMLPIMIIVLSLVLLVTEVFIFNKADLVKTRKKSFYSANEAEKIFIENFLEDENFNKYHLQYISEQLIGSKKSSISLDMDRKINVDSENFYKYKRSNNMKYNFKNISREELLVSLDYYDGEFYNYIRSELDLINDVFKDDGGVLNANIEDQGQLVELVSNIYEEIDEFQSAIGYDAPIYFGNSDEEGRLLGGIYLEDKDLFIGDEFYRDRGIIVTRGDINIGGNLDFTGIIISTNDIILQGEENSIKGLVLCNNIIGQDKLDYKYDKREVKSYGAMLPGFIDIRIKNLIHK